ncbi:unnamed protein product [Dovyalis caffra]|uniref:Uncharacterized protein n=1 Tax=Dovyalis caffra TaxID=77055 RepID=A0AAV1SMQ2_9ROSI|nr:unnamed protein product [Dovyalis caffra]
MDSSKPYAEIQVWDQDMLEEVTIVEEPTIVDFHHLVELTNYTDGGSSQLAQLVQQWEYEQANAVRILREELDSLSKQREEVELKKGRIFSPRKKDRVISIYQDIPGIKGDIIVQSKGEFDTVAYWKQRAAHSEKLSEASVHREQLLMEKLQENLQNLEKQSTPVEELTQILKRADNFLHFVLQDAPVIIGHQDKDLRYRFIYNRFPHSQEEDPENPYQLDQQCNRVYPRRKVGINLYVVSDPCCRKGEGNHQKSSADQSTARELKEDKPKLSSQSSSDRKSFHSKKYSDGRPISKSFPK